MLKTVHFVELASLLDEDEHNVLTDYISISFGDAWFTLATIDEVLDALDEGGISPSRQADIRNTFNAACSELPPKVRAFVNLEPHF
jgi:hypothetical protein